jgi:hypothetical protein
VSLGMAFMNPGIMPRFFFMSLSVSSYSPICFTVVLFFVVGL